MSTSHQNKFALLDVMNIVRVKSVEWTILCVWPAHITLALPMSGTEIILYQRMGNCVFIDENVQTI